MTQIPEDFVYRIKMIMENNRTFMLAHDACVKFEDIGLKKCDSYKPDSISFEYDFMRYLVEMIKNADFSKLNQIIEDSNGSYFGNTLQVVEDYMLAVVAKDPK
jgi:hypothetical protein